MLYGPETGPYLYVMFDGPDLTPFDTATATAATLTGPGGPVDVARVDNNHTPGLEGYLPPGMQVIPRSTLQPATTYTATVSAGVTTQGGAGPARSFSRTWSFTTGARANAVHNRPLDGLRWDGHGGGHQHRPRGDDDRDRAGHAGLRAARLRRDRRTAARRRRDLAGLRALRRRDERLRLPPSTASR